VQKVFNGDMAVIVGPAFAAGLMIALTHVPLGIAVLQRGIIFIDLAIAQIAGLGALAAVFWWSQPVWWVVQASALSSAFCAALFFRGIERFWPEQQEAVIGCGYVISVSMAILLLAGNPNGGEEIQNLLSGQLLFVSWRRVVLHAPIYAAILALWFLQPKARKGVWFYLLFSTAITLSVQLTGVFVVFASLIAPALGAVRYSGAAGGLYAAYSIALIGLVLGFGAAILTDLPLGPVLVCGLMIAAVCVGLWSGGRRRIQPL
jgi:zinc/manganese transport system permease protein